MNYKQKYLFSILFLSLFMSAHAIAEQNNFFSDTAYIHTYKGHTGYWKKVYNYNQLIQTINKYGSSYNRVFTLNGRIEYNSYIFIPYSKKYMAYLKKYPLYSRPVVQSKPDKMAWPIRDVYRISSSFGMRWGKLHPGIDLPVVTGRPILAIMDGIVTSVGYAGGYGNCICVQHRNGFSSLYAHNSANFVREGDIVRKGQIVGLVGTTGNSTGSHLHFELRYESIPLNPLDFLPQKEKLCEPEVLKKLEIK